MTTSLTIQQELVRNADESVEFANYLKTVDWEKIIEKNSPTKDGRCTEQGCGGKVRRKVTHISLRGGIETGPATCKRCGHVYLFNGNRAEEYGHAECYSEQEASRKRLHEIMNTEFF